MRYKETKKPGNHVKKPQLRTEAGKTETKSTMSNIEDVEQYGAHPDEGQVGL